MRINQLALIKERALFTTLLQKGVAAGAFDARQAERLPWLHTLAFQASDYFQSNSIFEQFNVSPDDTCENMIDFILYGLLTDTKKEIK